MIIFAAVTWRSESDVSTQLIVGGVSLLSIVITAYTGFATFEDTRLWGQQNIEQDEHVE
jgi:hypothetical protein